MTEIIITANNKRILASRQPRFLSSITSSAGDLQPLHSAG